MNRKKLMVDIAFVISAIHYILMMFVVGTEGSSPLFFGLLASGNLWMGLAILTRLNEE